MCVYVWGVWESGDGCTLCTRHQRQRRDSVETFPLRGAVGKVRQRHIDHVHRVFVPDDERRAVERERGTRLTGKGLMPLPEGEARRDEAHAATGGVSEGACAQSGGVSGGAARRARAVVGCPSSCRATPATTVTTPSRKCSGRAPHWKRDRGDVLAFITTRSFGITDRG